MILEEIARRHSVRTYSKKKVEDWKLREIIEAGRLALSVHNYQPWRFIVVKDGEKRRKMAETRWGRSNGL